MWLDTADMSDHGPIIALEALQVRLGQWPSFTGMEHGAPQARAIYMVMGLAREVTGSSALKFLHSPHEQKACHPGSRRKLPPPAYQVRPGLHFVVCRQ